MHAMKAINSPRFFFICATIQCTIEAAKIKESKHLRALKAEREEKKTEVADNKNRHFVYKRSVHVRGLVE